MLVKRIAVRARCSALATKRALQVNLVMLAVMLASSGWWCRERRFNKLLVQLFIFGGFNSMQFSASEFGHAQGHGGESEEQRQQPAVHMVQMLASGVLA